MKKTVLLSISAALLMASATQSEQNVSQLQDRNLSVPAVKTAQTNENAKKIEESYVFDRNKMMQEQIRKTRKDLNYKRLEKTGKEVLRLLEDAVLFTEENKIEDAKKNVEMALRKIEEVKKEFPDVKDIPVDIQGTFQDFPGKAHDVREALKTVKRLIDERKLYEARGLLDLVKSEMDLYVDSIPVKKMEDSLILANYYLQKNDAKTAKQALIQAKNSVFRNVIVVPIPLLMAEKYLKAALNTDKQEEKATLLKEAYDMLEKGKELGYFNKQKEKYKKMKQQIESEAKKIGLQLTSGMDNVKKILNEKVREALKLFE